MPLCNLRNQLYLINVFSKSFLLCIVESTPNQLVDFEVRLDSFVV